MDSITSYALPSRLSLFAECTPGLEPITASELKGIGAARVTATNGGVLFDGSLEMIPRANLQLRTANRIMITVAEFPAPFMSELEKNAAKIQWLPFIPADLRVDVHVHGSCSGSKIYHSEAAAERVARAITVSTGRKMPEFSARAVKDPENTIEVMVRIVDDFCTIRVDTSGSNLHRRGYRLETARAPLRETVAAAALLFSGWDGTVPLIDPLCGSGTLIIEGALIAMRRAPGLSRSFAFRHLHGMSAEIFERELERARNRQNSPQTFLCGSDRDEGAVNAATRNAERAGVTLATKFTVSSLSALRPGEAPGLIICNPPWGERIGHNAKLRDLYAAIGQLATQNPGWKLCLITADEQLARATGLSFTRISPPIPNGGIRIRFFVRE